MHVESGRERAQQIQSPGIKQRVPCIRTFVLPFTFTLDFHICLEHKELRSSLMDRAYSVRGACSSPQRLP